MAKNTEQIRTLHTRVEKLFSSVWSYGASVPPEIADEFLYDNARRVVCTINGQVEIHCAIMPQGDGAWYILLNKDIRTKLDLEIGSPVELSIRRDTSEYGLPMCEELREVFATDERANERFHALTPGLQRSLIYWAGNVKNPEKRIVRCLALAQILVESEGKPDFKRLNEMIKVRR